MIFSKSQTYPGDPIYQEKKNDVLTILVGDMIC